jgi:hypothetical protein
MQVVDFDSSLRKKEVSGCCEWNFFAKAADLYLRSCSNIGVNCFTEVIYHFKRDEKTCCQFLSSTLGQCNKQFTAVTYQ